MADVVDINAIRANLAREMKAKGFAAKRLSKVAGLGETAVRDIMNSDSPEGPRAGTLLKLAEALDVSAASLLSGEMPIEGKVGAGGSILFEEDAEKEMVQRPPLATGRLMALKVTGDSMYPVYRDGDVVFVSRDIDGVSEEDIGEECAVHTYEGGTFLKVLETGSEPNRYTLRSHNAAPMENVELLWSAPVRFIQRAKRAKK